jgi:hypothetical protein
MKFRQTDDIVMALYHHTRQLDAAVLSERKQGLRHEIAHYPSRAIRQAGPTAAAPLYVEATGGIVGFQAAAPAASRGPVC